MSDTTIGEIIKYSRSKLGLTQKTLAEKADLSLSAIQLYEAGKRTPKPSTLFKLADVLKAPELEQFIPFGEDDPLENLSVICDNQRDKQYDKYFSSLRKLYESDVFIVDMVEKLPNMVEEEHKKLAAEADAELYSIIPEMIDVELDFLKMDAIRELQRIIYDMLKIPENTTDEYKELLKQSENKTE